MIIHPVILCGGSGTRLWPVSRRSYPKQFASLIADESLFQAAAHRVSGSGYAAPIIVTAEPFRFIAVEQLASIQVAPAGLLLEPVPRNTAPAILVAALWQAARDPSALMLVVPSDHAIPDSKAFQAAVNAAQEAASQGQIITFGIPATRPETGYGYLELDQAADLASGQPHPLLRFVEKPNVAEATQMITEGSYLWNAGIFLARAETLIAAYQERAPELVGGVNAALATAETDLGFTRLGADEWARLPDISVDYAVMEKMPNLGVMPLNSGWSDLGGWDAVWAEAGPDENGNVCSQNATAIDCNDTLLRADSEGLEVVGIGLDDIIAVAMSDAVLIGRKSAAQDVRHAASALKARGAVQAEQFPREHRPWGWFENLITGPRFRVKRIVVNPGGSLSLQSHHHRAEHWVVVEGTAQVSLDGETRLISENQSIYVPVGAKHRLENPGKLPMVLIEVQTGGYLGEDDIIRYDDLYARD